MSTICSDDSEAGSGVGSFLPVVWEQRMAEEPWIDLPEHVVAKITQVLGIPPSELAKQDLLKLIEDLCDTALMFDRAERGTAEADTQGEQPSPPQPNPADTP